MLGWKAKKADDDKVKSSEKKTSNNLPPGPQHHLDCSSPGASLLCPLSGVIGWSSAFISVPLWLWSWSQRVALARWSPALFWLPGHSASETRTRRAEEGRRRSSGCAGRSSHLHLALHQVGPELLSCADDLPLVSQQVDAQVLDVSEGREQTDQRLSVNPSEFPAGRLESKMASRRRDTRSRRTFVL